MSILLASINFDAAAVKPLPNPTHGIVNCALCSYRTTAVTIICELLRLNSLNFD